MTDGQQQSVWFVETRVNGHFDGWYTAPAKGVGGWLTSNPCEAKQYTEAEAMAVAQALSYFRSPFRFSEWIATEHIFISGERAALTREDA